MKHKLNNYNKILITHTAFIGDIILALPLVAKIKELNPNTKIDFLTTKTSSNIPNLLKEINKTIIYDKYNTHKGIGELRKLTLTLKKNNYDCIISPHKSFRTTLINFILKPKLSVSFDISNLSFLYKKRVKYINHQHEIIRNLNLLTVFEEFNNYNYNLLLHFEDKSIQKVKSMIESINDFIIIAPGSIWETKRWLIEHYIDLTNKLLKNNEKIILIGSESDSELCNKIINNSKNNPNLLNLCGKLSINESIYLISLSKLIICNDSAPIHFANITKTKTIAIFGPTIPEFGFAPIGTDDLIFQNNELDCRPCSIHGAKKCPLGHFHCMKSITADDVFRNVNS